MFNHPAAVKPGDTIYLRGGRYEAPNRLNYNCRLNGSASGHIVLRPYRDENVIIDGGLTVLGSWIVIRDLEIMNSNPKRHTAQSGSFPSDINRPTGVDVFGKNVKVINNIIHDTGNGIAAWRDASNTEVYGNIVYYSGWQAPDRGHGHGAYMQNNAGGKALIDNVFFHQFGQGMQIYGSSSTYLNNFHLEGNVVFNNGSLANNFTRNILLGGTVVATNPIVRNNYTYYPTIRNHGGDNNIGYYTAGAGCTNLTFDGNYFVSGGISLSLWRCTTISVSGNTLIGETRGFTPASYPNNTYRTVAQRPLGQAVFVRPNRYETGRAHIIVYNWDRRDTATVDLSNTGLAPGEAFEIRDTQNILGAPVTSGTYTGAPVSLRLHYTTVSTPVGTIPPPHTDKEFNAYLVRRVGGPSTSVPLPLQVSGGSVSQITSSSAVIGWSSNKAASSQVEYGTTAALGSASGVIPGPVTQHRVSLSGLPAAATVWFKVLSRTTDGEQAESAIGQFQTPALPSSPSAPPAPTPGTGTILYRINAGGPQYTANGQTWSADQYFNTGQLYKVSTAISGTTNAPLYQTERWDHSSAPTLKYEFPVPVAGIYRVRLHFAETFSSTRSVGARVFDVKIENQTVLPAFDIFKEAGANTALVKSFDVNVSDGKVTIEFLHRVQNPKINAIEIFLL